MSINNIIVYMHCQHYLGTLLHIIALTFEVMTHPVDGEGIAANLILEASKK